MFPFWDLAIAPVFDAVGARRVVEIGALRGETTVLMLDRLGADAELHVIDPVPAFDPSEHEQQFGGRYVFHRALSHDVLPTLPPMDVALIDGDHNWYTVYHELRMLRDVARAAGAPLPVMIMHDVGWPYGRRDLYYAPETIPAEFRQDHAQAGMTMGRKKLNAKGGGVNPTLHNALVEGGPRNGVMTALDDFIAEHDRPIRRIVLPIYFGLALVAEEQRLQDQPELARLFEWLESAEGRGELLELAEQTRLQATLGQHNAHFQREEQIDRVAGRYLDLLQSALLDEHYLENELRVQHLAVSVESGQPPDDAKLRDPRHEMSMRFHQLVSARRAGKLDGDTGQPSAYLAYTTMGVVALDRLRATLDVIRREAVEGDYVDCGTGRGGAAILLRGYAEIYEQTARRTWVVDPFRSDATTSPERAVNVLSGGAYLPAFQPDLNVVRTGFEVFDLLDDRVVFVQGEPADTLPSAPIEKVALLHIGADLADGSADALDGLYDRIAIGGFVLIDDYGTPARQAAVDDFRARVGADEPIERIGWNAAIWRKTHHATGASRAPREPALTAARAPAAPPAPTDRKDLTVVVVFYKMQREAVRTLHSLSRAYQLDVDDLDYEVIAIENGTPGDQALGRELVESFGPEFRYVDMGVDAKPSPVGALNRGVELGRGDVFALMIDGAHVLTPRVLHYGMKGVQSYAPAIALTQQWYVGPGQQPDMVPNGYDQEYEDRLFEEIAWPKDGYGLFDIGHFIGDRDWLDGMWESNCIFIPRTLLQQYGAFDEGFSVPGGGYANLDLFERIGSAPDVHVVSILGEGSFHQVHGGTTTNQLDAEERNRSIVAYADSYSDVRGKPYVGPREPMRFVGSIASNALRTRSRRMVAPHFWRPRSGEGGPPDKASPLPAEVTEQFIEATWESLAWRKTKWMGVTVPRPPTDLFVYQELVFRVQPDWIIETGTRGGGRALFFANLCDLLGRGQVISIDPRTHESRPEHDRITHLTGRPRDDEILAEVRARVGEAPHGLLVLGLPGGAQGVEDDFDAYCDFVSVGSYAVIEDTIVNGHPVWPEFGPGPMEAVKRITNRRGNFAPDAKLEKFGLTFSPHGFLKRLR